MHPKPFDWLNKVYQPLHESYTWFAINHNGAGYVYVYKPIVHSKGWRIGNNWLLNNSPYHVGTFSTVDWQKSLLKREAKVYTVAELTRFSKATNNDSLLYNLNTFLTNEN